MVGVTGVAIGLGMVVVTGMGVEVVCQVWWVGYRAQILCERPDKVSITKLGKGYLQKM